MGEADAFVGIGVRTTCKALIVDRLLSTQGVLGSSLLYWQFRGDDQKTLSRLDVSKISSPANHILHI